jgi:SAM-dependent methyltransferase
MHQHAPISPDRAQRLMDPRRLETQLSERDLIRLLALTGNEDVIDLGSGVGFYTDLIAALTTGTVYALDLQPEMHDFYRARGMPPNVRLVLGDLSRLELTPAGADVACSISVWHETGGEMDLPGLARALRPKGRLVIVDWRKDPEPGDGGPPAEIRFSKEEVAGALLPYFQTVLSEDLGRNMFAVVAVRVDQPGGSWSGT